ncbi:MAG: hypothetical protein IPH57_18665 [Saprospiraceae bacterium]|nr:hypothetical protein [Saprospiraceae bacterium]
MNFIPISFRYLILLFIISPAVVKTQPPLPVFEKLGPEQGFKNSEVFDILKSSSGYIWVATSNGLVRYDGHSFLYFNSDPENKYSISGDYVKSVCEDDYGRLWLVASDQINVLDVKRNIFYQPKLETNNGVEKPYDVENIVYNPKDKKVWFMTTIGLYCNRGNEIRPVKKTISNKIPFKGQIALDRDTNLMIITNVGLFQLDKDQKLINTINRNYNKEVSKVNNDFISFYNDGNHLYAGMYFNGLAEYESKGPKNYFFDKNTINTVYCLNDFPASNIHLLLGTSSGLLLFNKSNKTFSSISLGDIYPGNTVQDRIYCVKIFNNDEIWIGGNRFIGKFDFKKNIFSKKNLQLITGKNLEISDVQFDPIFKNDSIAWIFSRYNGLFKYDMVRNKKLPLPKYLEKFADIDVADFKLKANGDIWILNVKHGITAYNLRNDRIIYKQAKEKIFYDLDFDKNGNLWLGNFSGLWLLNLKNGIISQDTILRNYLNKNHYNHFPLDLDTDSNGNIWMLFDLKGKSRVIVYNPEKGRISVDINHKCNLFNQKNLIEGIKISDSGSVYLYGSKCVVRIPNGHYNSLISEHNCFHNNEHVFDIEESKNNIWWSSLGKVTQSLKSTFNTITELNYSNTNMPVPISAPYIKYSKSTGRFYVFANNEIAILKNTSFSDNQTFNPFLSNLFINNSRVNNLDSIINNLVLPFGKNSLTFEFSNFCYTNSNLNKYYFKLKKGNTEQKNWEQTDKNRIDFRNLDHGRYTLTVTSENFLGLNSNKDLVIYFRIKPPFLESFWFYLLFILAVGAFFYGLFRYRVFQMQKLEKLRLSIARDLHDDIGSHLSQIKILSEIESRKSDTPEAYKKISSGLNDVMRNMSEIVWNINPKYNKLSDVIIRIQEFAIETLEPININLNFKLEKTSDNFNLEFLEKRHIYLIFKEAVINIAKYSKAENVVFSVKKENKLTNIKIEDDGNGFDLIFTKRGNGLSNMKNRAKSIKSHLVIDSSSQGTIITLILKPKSRFKDQF